MVPPKIFTQQKLLYNVYNILQYIIYILIASQCRSVVEASPFGRVIVQFFGSCSEEWDGLIHQLKEGTTVSVHVTEKEVVFEDILGPIASYSCRWMLYSCVFNFLKLFDITLRRRRSTR